MVDKELCTSCTACYSICPLKCISMETDEFGFIYPQKGEKCINCGKCEQVCPRSYPRQMADVVEQRAYAALTKDKHLWKKSASGGAFPEICECWGDDKTILCGAAWDGLEVKHVCVERKELPRLCKSKYVASNLGDTFGEIKKYLLEGRWVVFSGLPCQVAGLKAFLGKNYTKLLLVDLICHGVGSPRVFEESIELVRKQLAIDKKVVGFSFRVKEKTYHQDHIEALILDDGERILVENDPYIQLFCRQDCLRESCGKNCIYRNKSRQGDITIGDFKQLSKVFPTLRGRKYNYSTIVFNSKKSLEILPKLSTRMEMYKCSINSIEQYNPLFSRQSFFSENRDEFFKQYHEEGSLALKKWTKPVRRYRVSFKGRIYSVLPEKIRTIIRKKG